MNIVSRSRAQMQYFGTCLFSIMLHCRVDLDVIKETLNLGAMINKERFEILIQELRQPIGDTAPTDEEILYMENCIDFLEKYRDLEQLGKNLKEHFKEDNKQRNEKETH